MLRDWIVTFPGNLYLYSIVPRCVGFFRLVECLFVVCWVPSDVSIEKRELFPSFFFFFFFFFCFFVSFCYKFTIRHNLLMFLLVSFVG